MHFTLLLDWPMMRGTLSIAACLLVAICGCERDAAPPPLPAPRTDVSLTVLVVDEPEIAQAIERLRGDWAELTDGRLAVEEASADDFSAEEPLSADVVIYPARYLGTLVEQKRVRPLRASVREDEDVAFREILPAIRDGELAYGGEYYALPFGSHVLARVAAGDEPGIAAEGRNGGHPAESAAGGAISSGEMPGLPREEFAAALVLLAYAAPQAKHPSQVAVLFDLETMEPRIDSPPFVAALQELITAGAMGEDGGAERPRWQWWPGPVTARNGSTDSRDRSPPAEPALPSSDRVYNSVNARWENAAGEDSIVPLVGGKSHIGSVTISSRDAAAAFRLLAWLAGRTGPRGGRISTAPTRRGTSDPLVERAFSQMRYLQVPRILEVDAYLAALDENVRRAWSGDLTPQDALADAAEKWNEITDRIGRPLQLGAYKKHLNLP